MLDALTLSSDQLLRFYLDAGVDESIGTTPVDRFSAPPPVPASQPVKPSAPVQAASYAPPLRPVAAPIAHQQISNTASHVVMGCHSLAELRAALDGFDGLPWKASALNTVFADGNPEADLMVIGEAPGQEEDQQGLPFVGKSGKLLDRMLASIGLYRTENVYITNVLPWRPLENRKPSLEEVAVCLPFLLRHIELAAPKVLLLLGASAASGLLARSEGVSRLRGHWHDVASSGLSSPIPAMPSFHPAYLLRTPAAKREAWHDLLMVRKRLDSLS